MQETPPPAASGPSGAPDVPSASDLPEVPDLPDVPDAAENADAPEAADGPVPDPGRRPLVPRVTVALLTLTGAVGVLFGLREYASIVAPLMLTANLFIAAFPIQTWLIRLGVPRVLAQTALALTVFAILGVFFYSLSWSIVALIAELPRYQAQFWSLYQEIVQLLTQFGVTEAQVLDQLSQVSPANFASILRGALGQVTGFLTVIVVLVTMIFMMVIDAGTFAARDGVLQRHQPLVWHSVADFVVGVRRYWVVSTVFGLIVAVIDTIGLMVLDVPLPIVWGILAFLTNYLPNVGFIIGLVPPALMALLANGPVTALIVVVFYSVVNFVIQSIIQPKFNGDAVGVTATVALLSLLLWSSVLGAMGALLALPMTLLAKALLVDHDPQLRWLNAFISNDPSSAATSKD